MKAVIDPDLCIGCELCVQECPVVFAMRDDKAVVIVLETPEESEGSCRDACGQCPVDAIAIEE